MRRSLCCAAMFLLTACGTAPPASSPPADVPAAASGPALKAVADFYWPYAALAAEVYGAGDRPDNYNALAFDSPSLRQEVREQAHPRALAFVRQLDQQDVFNRYDKRYELLCGARARGEAQAQGWVEALDRNCRRLDDQAAERLRREALAREESRTEPNAFEDAAPQDEADCRFVGREPRVPVNEALVEYQWTRLPEFHAEAPARGWSLFVPDLAIDVWRRPRAPVDGTPTVEYALVYRGTVGGGGWVSNLRGVTSFTPFVWDQYRQADRASRTIIRRIQRLHALSDLLHERRTPTRLYITTVGHSLGAGLASYIHVLNPEVTRTVGFNPSPVDGTSMVRVGDQIPERRPSRAGVNQQLAEGLRSADPGDPGDGGDRGTRRLADGAGIDGRAAIFQLHEDGEVLSRFSRCTPGPIWGDEGGPRLHCDVVNLSRGSWIRQHNMAQMACKLALVHAGKPATPD